MAEILVVKIVSVLLFGGLSLGLSLTFASAVVDVLKGGASRKELTDNLHARPVRTAIQITLALATLGAFWTLFLSALGIVKVFALF